MGETFSKYTLKFPLHCAWPGSTLYLWNQSHRCPLPLLVIHHLEWQCPLRLRMAPIPPSSNTPHTLAIHSLLISQKKNTWWDKTEVLRKIKGHHPKDYGGLSLARLQPFANGQSRKPDSLWERQTSTCQWIAMVDGCRSFTALTDIHVLDDCVSRVTPPAADH